MIHVYKGNVFDTPDEVASYIQVLRAGAYAALIAIGKGAKNARERARVLFPDYVAQTTVTLADGHTYRATQGCLEVLLGECWERSLYSPLTREDINKLNTLFEDSQ